MRCSAGRSPWDAAIDAPMAPVQCEREAVKLFRYESLGDLIDQPNITICTLYGNTMVAALCEDHCPSKLSEGWKELSFSEFKALESVWEVQEE